MTLSVLLGLMAGMVVTGGLGALWLVVWYFVARPPFLPAVRHAPSKFIWPNMFERRAWVVISSFGLGGVALGSDGTVYAQTGEGSNMLLALNPKELTLKQYFTPPNLAGPPAKNVGMNSATPLVKELTPLSTSLIVRRRPSSPHARTSGGSRI